MMGKGRVAVVGATGLVGRSIVECLEKRRFSASEIVLYASPRSEGKVLHAGGKPCRLTGLARDRLGGFDVVFFSTPPGVCREYGSLFAREGASVVDLSGDWVSDPGTPLVVPEVNAREIPRGPGIVASPAGSAVPLALALKPVHDAVRVRRAVVTAVLSASGGGRREVEAFENGMQAAVLDPSGPAADALGVAPPSRDGEEARLASETARVLGDAGIRIAAACVRVPVRNGCGESVVVETEGTLRMPEALDLFRGAAGLRLCEPPEGGPSLADAAGNGDVRVGRVRGLPGGANGLRFWLACDNLLKGSALNAVQIAEGMRRT